MAFKGFRCPGKSRQLFRPCRARCAQLTLRRWAMRSLHDGRSQQCACNFCPATSHGASVNANSPGQTVQGGELGGAEPARALAAWRCGVLTAVVGRHHAVHCCDKSIPGGLTEALTCRLSDSIWRCECTPRCHCWDVLHGLRRMLHGCALVFFGGQIGTRPARGAHCCRQLHAARIDRALVCRAQWRCCRRPWRISCPRTWRTCTRPSGACRSPWTRRMRTCRM